MLHSVYAQQYSGRLFQEQIIDNYGGMPFSPGKRNGLPY